MPAVRFVLPKRLWIILSVAVAILCIPLIAMQVTQEVNWSWLDFAIAGILLPSAGLSLELILRKIVKINYKVIAISALLLILFIIWAELGVGLFETPFAGD